MRSAWCLALVCLVSTGCSCEPAGQPDPDARAPDAAPPDATLPDAAASDAIVEPDAGHEWGLDPAEWEVTYPPCDATEIQLPPTGWTSVFQVSNQGSYVVYDDRRNGDILRSDIYLYDLNTCHEYVVTRRDSAQATPSIWGTEIVFNSWSEPGSWECQVTMFDLASQEFTILPAPLWGTRALYNGRHVLYDTWEETADGGTDLTLWDLQTGESTRLAEAQQGAEGSSLSLTHAAWVAWGGPDKDVYYADLQTAEVVHVASTYEPYTAHTATWGDWVLWEDSRFESKVNIMALRISTQEEIRLTDNGEYNGRPTLRHNIASWRTTLWGGTTGWDLVVFDLETGVLRRVTTESHPGYKWGTVDGGWFVYQRQLVANWDMNQIFAKDLVAAGILDPTGQHVLPEPGGP